jgi:hypothetical protein
VKVSGFEVSKKQVFEVSRKKFIRIMRSRGSKELKIRSEVSINFVFRVLRILYVKESKF